MILTERNVNEETSFLDDSPGLFHHWDCLHPSYDWDVICLCSSFSRLSPNGVVFFRAAIGLDRCGMRHLPDCDDF